MIDAGGIEASGAVHAGKVPMSRVANMIAFDSTDAGQTPSDPRRPRTRPALMHGAAAMVFRTTLQDFRRGDPLLLMIDQFKADRVYFLDYFMRDSGFAQMFSEYTFLGTIEQKLVFRRLRPGEARVQPPRPKLDAPSGPVVNALSLRKRRLSVFLGFLLVLGFAEVRRRRQNGKGTGADALRRRRG
jgi:hypothetical protein